MLSGACCLCAVAGLGTWWCSMVTKVPKLVRNSVINRAFVRCCFAENWVWLLEGSFVLQLGVLYVEPTKIPCLSEGISAGLWVGLEAAWSIAGGQQPAVACKRNWESLRTFWLAVLGLLLQSFLVQSAQIGGCSPTLQSGLFPIGSCRVTQFVRCTPLCFVACCLAA